LSRRRGRRRYRRPSWQGKWRKLEAIFEHLRGYELKESLSTGMFGTVYRAIQPSIGREVAIKTILPRFANDPEFIRRFEAEAHRGGATGASIHRTAL
jgi:serine/threonine protein kinase